MANTYTLINSTTLSTTAASVTFSAIPATYDDLILLASIRSNQPNEGRNYFLEFNNVTTGQKYSVTMVYGNGASAASLRYSDENTGIRATYGMPGSVVTSNTFSNTEIYIPGYTLSQNKPVSLNGVTENNATTAYINSTAGLWRDTSAISTVKFTTSDNFVSGSSFYLYGIKNT